MIRQSQGQHRGGEKSLRFRVSFSVEIQEIEADPKVAEEYR